MNRVLAPPPLSGANPVSGRSFSIVITAYQAADTIADAVDSALEQSEPALEVIVVDDGSSDDIDGALARFEDRIRLVRKENGGGASARNAGLKVARGDYLAILDADDRYHPRRLAALAALAAERPDLELITTDARFVVDGEGVGSFLGHNRFPVEDQRTAIFESCFPGGWPAVRVDALRAAGGFDESFRIAYDWDCWLRMILAGAQAGLVTEPYYDYVLHSESLAAGRAASLGERVRLLEKAWESPALLDDERPSLERALRERRTQAAHAVVAASLAGEAPRSELLRLARSWELPMRVRGLSALAFAAPPLGRLLTAHEAPPERRFAGEVE